MICRKQATKKVPMKVTRASSIPVASRDQDSCIENGGAPNTDEKSEPV
jgi:hypothetical protein